MLRFLGYHVGHQGVEPEARKQLLSRVFRGDLPPFHSPRYMAEWGKPQSALRLRKIAESIAAFARNNKRRHDPSLDQAIADWEADLEFLYDEFYAGYFHFDFHWPSTIP